MTAAKPAIWFLAIRAGTGADVFTTRLCAALNALGIRSEITWLPHRAEYLPWLSSPPQPPPWATIAHVNTWLHRRFLPSQLPIVATMHHVVHDASLAPFKRTSQSLYHRFWIKEIEQQVLARADAISCVSQYTANQLNSCFGKTQSVVIHNGVDLSLFEPTSSFEPSSTFRLVYVGSWSKRKGSDMLATIMDKLGTGFELRYTGPPRPMPENCTSLGRIDTAALVELYGNSDALLFPSRLEGFGQVAAEAMACGLPVVAGRNSALPEVVKHQHTGLLVEHDCPQDYVDAIKTISSCRSRWLEMSAAARKHAIANFDIIKMAESYAQLYCQLIEQGNAHVK